MVFFQIYFKFLANLLIKDVRLIERKKFGKHKARKSFKWFIYIFIHIYF